ncbi:hypothetical protein MMC08_004814 [Hypocenomyce scalaris]|nr:hypothetical protein [Hypocenomyce scalaris]
MQASQTGSYNEQYSNSIQSEPIENIQLSHLVNRKALPGPSKNPSASTTNYAPIGAEQSVERWSTRPKELNQSTHAWDLAFLWDIFITILPVFFLVLGISALVFDGKPISTPGDNIVRATSLGPTLFPIIFASLVGRLMRSVSVWRAQNGGKLGFLEQLNGSQSLAGALERAWCLRRYGIISTSILALWTLSPLGGQSALRILSKRTMNNFNTQQLHYINSGTDSGFDGLSSQAYDLSMINSLYTAALLSPENAKQSSMDSWGNVKVPIVDTFVSDSGQNHTVEDGTFVMPNQSQTIEYSSLIGIIVVGTPGTGNFTIETSYFRLNCGNIVHGVTQNEILPYIGKTQIHNSTTIFELDTFGLDTNALWPNGSEPAPDINPNIVFISFNDDYGSGAEGYYVAKCNLTQPTVESQVTCNDGSCKIDAMRQLDPGINTYFNYEDFKEYNSEMSNYSIFEAFMVNLPLATGTVHSGTSTPTEQYLVGASQLFYEEAPVQLNVTDPVSFSLRLTRIFNTYWQPALAPVYTAGNYPTNQTLYQNETTAPFLNNAVTAMLPHPQTVYKADRVWVGLLLITTLILQICAIAGLIIKRACTIPDILGYISTMTRDNPYLPLPEGGNTLDGLERARLLYDLQVQVADVRWESDIGHLALKTVDSTLGLGKVEKNRYYI